MILVTVEKKIDGYAVREGRGGGRRLSPIYTFQHSKRVVTLQTHVFATTPREPSHLSSFSRIIISLLSAGSASRTGIGNERSIVPVGALSDGKRGEVRGWGCASGEERERERERQRETVYRRGMKTALVNGFLPDSFTRFSPFPSVSVVPLILRPPPLSSFFFSLSPTFIFSPPFFSLSFFLSGSFISSLPNNRFYLTRPLPPPPLPFDGPPPVFLALQTASSCLFSLPFPSSSYFSSFNQPVAGQVVARRVTTPFPGARSFHRA